MEVNPLFEVNEEVSWITNLVDTCETCGHHLHTTHYAVWSGRIVSVIITRAENRQICVHDENGNHIENPPPPPIENSIEYSILPNGDHSAGCVIISEAGLYTSTERAQQALDNQTTSQ